MVKKIVWIGLLLSLVVGCADIKSLNIPDYLIGKSLNFRLKGCNYKQANCRDDLENSANDIGDVQVNFEMDNIVFKADDSVKTDAIYGALFSSLNDVKEALNNNENLKVLQFNDMEVVDYEERNIDLNTYVLLFMLKFSRFTPPWNFCSRLFCFWLR